MQDEQIVALYWDRKEDAICQTQQKYGAYLSKIAYNILIGRYYFFDSLKDVAAYCGMSEAKAKSMLYRTRQSLKAYLVKEGFDL